MASGKTRVGRALAGLLGWRFLDFDEVIQEEAGLTIPDIFSRYGERHFRDLEASTGDRLLALEAVVLATGGGWPAQPGRMDGLPKGTRSVWLQVSAEEAVDRARNDGPIRPMLNGPNALERAKNLLREREPFYRLAHLAIDSSTADPDILAQRIRDFFLEDPVSDVRGFPPHK